MPVTPRAAVPALDPIHITVRRSSGAAPSAAGIPILTPDPAQHFALTP
ncbi:MAG: hypothetical protein U1F36_02405 [Planctomycetota bacterium]